MQPLRFTDALAAMRYAIECAKRGLGYVEPNPAVGAVLMDDSGNLLAEGWHKFFGGPHAEIDCLSSLAANTPDESERLQLLYSATMYVTLEPCCHTGKTGPCSKALIASGIRRVIIGLKDPSPHVAGGGIAELRAAGISVEVGIAAEEASRLVRPFVHLGRTNRPWVHAKWAMTLDGKIATRSGSSQWISNEQSRAAVHKLRGRMDAIIVGAGTARADDPTLTARPPGPRTATRIVLDSQATLSIESNLVRTLDEAPVMLVCSQSANPDSVVRLRELGVEIVQLAGSDSSMRPSVELLLDELGRRSMTNVLVEGGGELLGTLFDLSLIDELHVFVAPKIVGGLGARSPIAGLGLDSMAARSELLDIAICHFDRDVYIHGIIG